MSDSAGQTTSSAGSRTSRGELERTLGLSQALAIGTGTMIGAGIFVFPGLAGGEAGAAATVSFGIGALVALMVALPASELATAMPESGGGYFFVSRSLGGLLGCMVGIGQWLGLVFAAAFYLVGFAYYLTDVLAGIGFAIGEPVTAIALITVALLTGISLLGTEKAGALQNAVVALLLVILAVFLGYGILSAAGLIGSPMLPETFAPFGVQPIFSTAALVFTSYLGFVQIATVAGEIKEPSRNLPRAMVGSVVLVGVLYVLTLFISTGVLAPAKLEELGETAIIEVARQLLGSAGAIAIMGAGMLATLSSANASLLSSSRSVYALSRDQLLPERAAAVNERFRTPHVSLLMAGVPIAGLLIFGRVEVLAEVASLLHLFMYGLICFTLIVLRRRQPGWYQPAFTCPGYPVLPALGGLASFALVFWMQPLSQIIGLGLLALSAGWYYLYGRAVDLKRASSTEPDADDQAAS